VVAGLRQKPAIAFIYFQQIETQIAGYVHILETNLLKDKRSLHIGIIAGELIFTDESVLHFIGPDSS
jgi:hypothetical protein